MIIKRPREPDTTRNKVKLIITIKTTIAIKNKCQVGKNEFNRQGKCKRKGNKKNSNKRSNDDNDISNNDVDNRNNTDDTSNKNDDNNSAIIIILIVIVTVVVIMITIRIMINMMITIIIKALIKPTKIMVIIRTTLTQILMAADAKPSRKRLCGAAMRPA